MTQGDRLLIVVLAAAILVSWPLLAAARSAGDTVQIVSASGVTSFSLSESGDLRIDGPSGGLTVRTENGSVRVVSAACPDLVCVRTGAVSTSGSVIACVPNGVVVRIGGGDVDGLDARLR